MPSKIYLYDSPVNSISYQRRVTSPASDRQAEGMSDDEADPELVALLRQSLGLASGSSSIAADTGVLKSAEYICDNAIDVAIATDGTKAAAETIWSLMQKKQYSTETWSTHELHPKSKDEATVNFIFTMNLLNFSFWSELSPSERFAVDYRGKTWTGYWSLVAALQRALDEGEYSLCGVVTRHLVSGQG